jgi:nitrite reductase/ring-hydroxylating ferredoxin subunit
MTLDWVENRFFSDDGRYLLCATHGACFEPTTGECVSGPALGRSLVALPIRIEAGTIQVRCPDRPAPSGISKPGSPTDGSVG